MSSATTLTLTLSRKREREQGAPHGPLSRLRERAGVRVAA
jgi:hypothetical protein